MKARQTGYSEIIGQVPVTHCMLREGLMQAVRFSTVSEGQSRRGQVDERMRS